MIAIFFIHIISWILAAICDAAMDKISFHYDKSIFRKKGGDTVDHAYFWNPTISWRNKYKRRLPEKGERFPGSTTVFVMFTDAFHLAQALMNFFIIVTIITGLNALVDVTWDWYDYILVFVAYKASYGFTFEIFFRKVFTR
jgi:hypothetical protein